MELTKEILLKEREDYKKILLHDSPKNSDRYNDMVRGIDCYCNSLLTILEDKK